MKLVSVALDNGAPVAGVLTNNERSVRLARELGAPADMRTLIAQFDQWRGLFEDAAAGTQGAVLATLSVVAPLPRPHRNIFCVGKNYHEHAIEFGRSGFDSGSIGGGEVPAAPIIFTKPASAVIGSHEPIHSERDPYNSVDYEGELAVVMGAPAQRVSRETALRHVFGYTIINDVTAREVQKIHKQWLLGKGIDGFCPMGPAIVTADAFQDFGNRRLQTHVNGELRQDASFAQLIFDVPALIETISRYITLEPGDVIATGTPAGVGVGSVPPKYLRSGDVVRVSVEGIGVLENPVV